jgi:DNA-binding HxlR family transcriptional regulator
MAKTQEHRDRMAQEKTSAGKASGKCPIENLLHRNGDSWSVLVIEVLDESPAPIRFNALRRRIGDVSQRMLTVTLRKLERDGLVSRRVLPGSPPAVDYTLSELGRSLAVPARALVRWAFDNLEAVHSAQHLYDAATEKDGD